MKPVQCSFCKGNLQMGKTDFTTKVEGEIVSIKDVPAYICDNCGEFYFDPDVSRRIDKVMQKVHKGILLAHPIPAGEIEFGRT